MAELNVLDETRPGVLTYLCAECQRLEHAAGLRMRRLEADRAKICAALGHTVTTKFIGACGCAYIRRIVRGVTVSSLLRCTGVDHDRGQ